MSKALVHHEIGFDRISLNVIYIFGFKTPVELSREPVLTGDPKHCHLNVGDRIREVGGNNTSAGFLTITMESDCCLEFTGHVEINGFHLLCFDVWQNGIKKNPDPEREYASAYYGFVRLDRHNWFVSNTAIAGRIIETSHIWLDGELL